MLKIKESTDCYGIGVDIGGTKILLVITDGAGNILFKEKTKSFSEIPKIISFINNCIQKAQIDYQRIIGMALGIPGRVNSREGLVIDAPSLKWWDLDLLPELAKHFNFPVYINNDVNYSLLGERWLGSGKKHDNIFYLSIGTGVGSAIMTNGQIIEGATFSAGEIGYFIDKFDVLSGLQNVNMEFGTFERKTSGTALSQIADEHGYTAPELFQIFDNKVVTSVVNEFILNISIAVANVVSLINPEIVIIGGGVSESMPVVIDEIRKKVTRFTPIRTEIVLSQLGGEVGALGAVAYVFNRAGGKFVESRALR